MPNNLFKADGFAVAKLQRQVSQQYLLVRSASMQKAKTYTHTRFAAEVIREATVELVRLYGNEKITANYVNLSVEHDESEWKYDSLEEFLADYRIYHNDATLHLIVGIGALIVWTKRAQARVNVQADSRARVESVFAVFEAARERSRIPDPPRIASSPVIFVGHGRSQLWRDLKDHLQEKHGCKIEAYETGARAGHSIRDILEEMVEKSSFAILVMTAEDEQADGAQRARQNVIHEAGLFQGRLGFARAIMLLEEGVEEFSNVQGVQYIRFARGNIKETYGEVLATLRREFEK
ncbi:TIR domain-containing protein [Rhodanobacter sp. Si-c]|uniref:TIR domain-containing protein n=1 Tax=Rhodanobacter lycopersici TaxID=3162487 RepID=A0ABV3Q9D6_9GAMM